MIEHHKLAARSAYGYDVQRWFVVDSGRDMFKRKCDLSKSVCRHSDMLLAAIAHGFHYVIILRV